MIIIYHNHHITPRCLLQHKSKSFVDRADNIIRVTLKQHIALHKWLFMLTGDRGCESAYHSMSSKKFHYNRQGRTLSNDTRQKMSESRQKFLKANPEYHKERSLLTTGKNNPMYGKTHSKQTRQKMSKNISGKNNHRYGVVGKNNPCSKLYKIIYPDGSIKIITGLNHFCKLNNLNRGCMNKVLAGSASHHKQFKAYHYTCQ